ncbi:MAG: sigma-70 family RNA polymerase sigma factor [Mucinivorans sp.]
MITDDIIHRCQQGDRGAQQLIYQELSAVMFGVSLRYAPSREVAQDWLHDGFISLFKHIDKYRFEGSFQGWARRVFVTTALSHLRHDRGWTVANRANEGELSFVESQTSNALQTMQEAEILRMINLLSPPQRAVLNLFSIEGFSHDEIAKMLHITTQNSRLILHRAKAELSKQLKKEGIIE